MKKSAVIVTRAKAGHQLDFGGAFAEGLRRHGWHAEMAGDYQKADLVVFWSVRRGDRIARAKADSCEVCILERGYLGDRFKWTSVSFGGELNGRAEFRGPFDNPSRWDKHFAHLMRPWCPAENGYALIMGQVAGDMSVRGVNIEQWYGIARKALEKQGWRVRFRPHPRAQRRGGHARGVMKQAEGDLQAALDGAAVVVTYSSNSGVDAALAGKPVIAVDEGSMARPVAGHTLRDVVMPDRTAWSRALAWKQWRKDEMANGECWEAINAGSR